MMEEVVRDTTPDALADRLGQANIAEELREAAQTNIISSENITTTTASQPVMSNVTAPSEPLQFVPPGGAPVVGTPGGPALTDNPSYPGFITGDTPVQVLTPGLYQSDGGISSPGGVTTFAGHTPYSGFQGCGSPGTPAYQSTPQLTPGAPQTSAQMVAPPTMGFVPHGGAAEMFSPSPAQHPMIFTPSPVSSTRDTAVKYPTPGQQPHYVTPQGAPEVLETPREASASINVPFDPQYQMTPEGHDDQSAGGLFGWFKNNELMNKVMEKTKSSVETMITTLDPGMKQVIQTGGDVDIVVTSAKDVKVGPVRDAFQQVFGRAAVRGMASQPNIAPQPVGYTAGLKGSEERVENLRRGGAIHERQPTVSVENFIVEVVPDSWYDIGCVLLRDPGNGINIQTYTQATHIPNEYVHQAQDQTPSDYPLSWSGLQITVGEIIHRNHPYIDPADWHMTFAGVSRRDMIFMAAKTLAYMYKQRLPVTS